jgi:hypothetical protein
VEGRLIPYPFAYQGKPHCRRHGPAEWKDYQRYRPWLRDEFSFRCVYCLNREQWVDRRRAYQIDHFTPQVRRPDLKADYTNFLYLCSACNHLKGAKDLPDPCGIALDRCLEFSPDGKVKHLDDVGERIIEVLELDDPRLVDWRRRKIGGLLSDAEYNWPRFVDEMRFPDDLPDLTLDPPSRNTRPEGISESWLAVKNRNELPEVY